MFDIIGKRRWFYLFSLLVTIPGIFAILLTFLPGARMGLQFSIDYTGGTIWEVHFEEGTPETADVRDVLVQQGLPDSSVAITTAGDRQYILIRTEEIGLQERAPATPPPTVQPSGSADPLASPGASSSPDPSGSPDPSASPGASSSPVPSPSPGMIVPTDGELGALAAALEERFGPIDEVRQESSVGPVISQEVVTGAILLIALGSIGILLWMTFRFGDFRMGTVAIAALVHDVVVVLGIFAILGTLFGLQLDALFVTAMLTVIGFSVHDTIVVFDRVRENRIRHAGEPFAAIVNHSLLQTLGRSVNTSLVVLITLASLLLFGGDAIRSFILALLIGIVSGTYSSIFNASALLVDWHEWAERRRQRAFLQTRAGG
ncbi:MAG: protein translocase subunit SecF [Chloroflexota bacterium]|nr:protein translocase subunit SecF [Chloroflexota bacterium]